jgi:hypothetical protein
VLLRLLELRGFNFRLLRKIPFSWDREQSLCELLTKIFPAPFLDTRGFPGNYMTKPQQIILLVNQPVR